MITVRWQGKRGPDRVPAHGWDFDDENDLFCRGDECVNWKQYAIWCAEHGPALRVWINNEIVWDWENGWYVNI